MTVTRPVTGAPSSRTAIPTPSAPLDVHAPPRMPHVPPPDDALTLAHHLRWIEDVLDTLAAWEDADDNVVLPEPLGGQRALHAVWRVRDGLVTGRPADRDDIRLVQRAVRTLTCSAANANEDLSEALLIHAPRGRPDTRRPTQLRTDLDRL